MSKRAVVWVLLALAASARAETSQVTASGFVSNFRAEVQATPDAVWKAIVQLPRWWDGRHSYSGQATNLSLEPRAGGCFCEQWGDGNSVAHARVVMVQAGRVLRMEGGLGPLQDLAAQGMLTLVTGTQDGKTLLRLTYRVNGNAEAGLDKLAAAVDQVMGTQFKRLKTMAETGQPD